MNTAKDLKTNYEPLYLVPDLVAAMPTELTRTALFSLLPTQKRRAVVKDKIICSRSDIELYFSGEELDVRDETLFLAMLRLSQKEAFGEKVYFTISELLKETGKTETGGINGSINIVCSRIDRLSHAHLKIKFKRNNKVCKFTTRLIEYGIEETNDAFKVYFRLDHDAAELYHNLAYQDWQVRLKLKSDMAKKLLTYITGHKSGTAHKQKLDNLRRWFGYGGQLYRFRPACFKALKEIEAMGIIENIEYSKTEVYWLRTAIK